MPERVDPRQGGARLEEFAGQSAQAARAAASANLRRWWWAGTPLRGAGAVSGGGAGHRCWLVSAAWPYSRAGPRPVSGGLAGEGANTPAGAGEHGRAETKPTCCFRAAQ